MHSVEDFERAGFKRIDPSADLLGAAMPFIAHDRLGDHRLAIWMKLVSQNVYALATSTSALFVQYPLLSGILVPLDASDAALASYGLFAGQSVKLLDFAGELASSASFLIFFCFFVCLFVCSLFFFLITAYLHRTGKSSATGIVIGTYDGQLYVHVHGESGATYDSSLTSRQDVSRHLQKIDERFHLSMSRSWAHS